MYVSLKDVAAHAGVSFQTASKVLNGKHGVVAEQTRERIIAVAEELGYVPNALARGLVSRSTVVGLLVDDFGDPALSQFVKAAEQELSGEGLAALIVAPQPGEDPALAVRKLREHRVAGVLVIAPGLEEHTGLGEALRGPLPAVSIHHVHGGGVPVVGSDHAATGRQAAEHLVSLEHRRIGTVTGVRGRRVVRSRHGGFRRQLQAAGTPLPSELVAEADWTPAGAHAATAVLLDTDPQLTAIFVHSDVMALGVLAALRDRDLAVPRQCSVVSCDNLEMAAYLSPPLTTVDVPMEATGRRAVDLLLRRVRGQPTPERVLLPTRLVPRGSTAPPPRTAVVRPTSPGRRTRSHARSTP